MLFAVVLLAEEVMTAVAPMEAMTYLVTAIAT